MIYRKRRSLWWGAATGLLVFIFSVFSFFDVIRVDGRSMSPELESGDVLLVWRLPYGLFLPFSSRKLVAWGIPERNELIIINRSGTRVVKRCIGLPGDPLIRLPGALRVGERVLQLYPRQERTELPPFIPEGFCFISGRNALVSEDSRDFGLIDLEWIEGRAFLLGR